MRLNRPWLLLFALSACSGPADDSTATQANPTTPTTSATPDPKPKGGSAPTPTGPSGPEPTGPEPTGPEPTGPSGPSGPTGPFTALRVIAANLTSGDGQSYDEGSGIDILEALHGDIVLLQEFRYGNNSSSDLRHFVDTTFGSTYAYVRETGYDLPNGVISRYPIISSGSWDSPKASNRGFAYARIDIPGDTDLWAISVHLLTANASTRDEEAKALIDELDSLVPVTDFVVLGGDFNTNGRSEACIGTLSAWFETSSPYPVDNNGNGNTNASRAKPYDWVLSSKTLASRERTVVLGEQSFAHGLVVDTRVYTPIADLAPASADDSAASNMQHMAVVKDYSLDP